MGHTHDKERPQVLLVLHIFIGVIEFTNVKIVFKKLFRYFYIRVFIFALYSILPNDRKIIVIRRKVDINQTEKNIQYLRLINCVASHI
jgi:hypothetical protein